MLRFNADGQPDATFNAGGTGAGGPIFSLAREPDGQLLIGGGTVGYNGLANVPRGLARLHADGSLDASFNGGGIGFNFGTIGAIAVQADGQVLAGSNDNRFNGGLTPRGLARVNGANGLLNDAPTPLPGATFIFTPGNTAGSTRTVTASGTYTATATDPLSGCAFASNAVVVTADLPDLVVDTPGQVVPGITYNNVTVTGTGVGTLQGNVTVNGALLVQTGGQLLSGCFVFDGTGSFTVAAGATLAICSPQGLSSTPGMGSVQTTGLRSFSDDATYHYNGSLAQVTGDQLPGIVRELGVDNPAGLTLSQGVLLRQRVHLASGNLQLNGQDLTLLSGPAGTALINNSGGAVVGTTGTMQRYIATNPAANGYRHYSSPVLGAGAEPISTLAAGGYVPDFSGAAAYNSSPTPGLVTPFPTVFGYN